MKIKIARVGVFVAGFVMILSAGMVTAEIPYYEGKTITVLVQSRVGGGTDTTARMIAAHLPKYIPGKPRIVLRNMPGGGGSIANNIFYERGNLDGLHLLMSGSSAVSMQLRERDIVKYNLMDLNPIGHISRGGNVLMVRKEAFPRLTDPSAAPVVIGTKEGEETWLAMTIWGAEFLGWNLRYIPGYAGSSDFAIAFQRGEIDMMGTSNAYLIEQRRNEGSVVLVTQMGTYGAEGNFLRRADFPDVPTFAETLGNKKPTGMPWQAYTTFTGPQMVDKLLFAPRGIPQAYLAILTEAFGRMARDKKFNESVTNILAEVYHVGVGEETIRALKMILDVPRETLDYTRGLQRKYGIIAK